MEELSPGSKVKSLLEMPKERFTPNFLFFKHDAEGCLVLVLFDWLFMAGLEQGLISEARSSY